MQIILLLVIVILSIVLYRLLSSRKMTYPFIKTTRLTKTDEGPAYVTTEMEQGLLTIDQDTVIAEGEVYHLKSSNGADPEASLVVSDGRLISVCVKLENGEKNYFIDPEHNTFLQSSDSEFSGSSASSLVSF